MIHKVTIREVRPRLTELLTRLDTDDACFVITRYGRPVAALVSYSDLHRIREAEEEELYGPVNPASGARPGSLILLGHPTEGGRDRWRVAFAKKRRKAAEARQRARYEARKAAVETGVVERKRWRWSW
jgi:prevent-host-death family protein